MIYLVWYLTLGIVVLAAAVLQFVRDKRKQSDVIDNVLDILDPSRKKPVKRVLNEFLVPLISGVWIIIAWPIVLLLEVKREIFSKEKPIFIETQEFKITMDDLVEKLSVSEIEERERINDPLEAVPDVAFGFLHDAWETFIKDMIPEDELWSFIVHEEQSAGREKQTAGYVIVKGKEIGRYFVVFSKEKDK